MSKVIIAITILLCMNIMLYMGGIKAFDGDIIDLFFEITADNKPTGLTGALNDSIPREVIVSGEGGGEAEPDDFRVSDIPRTIFALFKLLLNLMFAPIGFFTSAEFNFPIEISFLFGLPFTILYVFIVINWWRGTD